MDKDGRLYLDHYLKATFWTIIDLRVKEVAYSLSEEEKEAGREDIEGTER